MKRYSSRCIHSHFQVSPYMYIEQPEQQQIQCTCAHECQYNGGNAAAAVIEKHIEENTRPKEQYRGTNSRKQEYTTYSYTISGCTAKQNKISARACAGC